MDARGRITVGQIVQLVFAMAFLAALVPVFYDSLDSNADVIGTGPGLILRALVPLLAIGILHWLWQGATEGTA